MCGCIVLCVNVPGGLSYKFVGTVLAIAIPTVVIFLAIAVQPNQPILRDYQQERILPGWNLRNMRRMNLISS